jgi:hypothetical protein
MAAAAAAVAAACRRAASYTLTGPPAEFFRVAAAATTVDKARAPAAAAASASDKYAQLLDAGFKTPDTPPPPAKTRTENNSPTFASSGDPCLDFFFHVVPDTPAESVASRFADAWAAEPLTALHLACNLHGVRGTGKSDREGFYAAALWMHERHPRTLALNARAVAGFGYLKDLPEILHRIIHGGAPTTGPRRRVAGKKSDEASTNPWETDHEAITRKFEEAGHGAAIPEVVFWNLRDSKSVPVTAGEKGVALVSGFSKNMVKMFLDNDGIVLPRAIMEKAISGLLCFS